MNIWGQNKTSALRLLSKQYVCTLPLELPQCAILQHVTKMRTMGVFFMADTGWQAAAGHADRFCIAEYLAQELRV